MAIDRLVGEDCMTSVLIGQIKSGDFWDLFVADKDSLGVQILLQKS